MIDNGHANRGFFASIPGILTAMAAVLTAAGGLYLGIQSKDKPDDTHTQQPVAINLTMSGQAAPTDDTAVADSDLRLGDAPAADTSGSDLVDQCLTGDDAACADLLDTLAANCRDGSGLDCDVLFEIAPAGSDWEAYGATCGGRFDPSVAGTCEDA